MAALAALRADLGDIQTITEPARVLQKSRDFAGLRAVLDHTTLHALKIDPTVTYLQVLYPPRDPTLPPLALHEHFGDEVMGHLAFEREAGPPEASTRQDDRL